MRRLIPGLLAVLATGLTCLLATTTSASYAMAKLIPDHVYWSDEKLGALALGFITLACIADFLIAVGSPRY